MSTAAFASQLESHIGAEMLSRLSAEIQQVEDELRRQVGSEIRLVRETSEHTLLAGGKRLRPALVSLSAEATGRPYDPKRTRRLGAGMEMIHMATLMHDDVIDHAATRRNRPTAAARFGNTASILSGDVLLSKAMASLAEDGDLAIIRNVSKAVVDLAEGEVHELETRGRINLTKEEHFAILHRKTATFIASCCQVGALAAGAPDEIVAALGRYGGAMGMAFQIADDMLDFAADPDTTGKPRGTDFREGCATLPIIRLLPSLDADARSRLEGLFGVDAPTDGLDWVHDEMLRNGTLADVEAEAGAFIAQAMAALTQLPESPTRDLLGAVAEFVVWRKA